MRLFLRKILNFFDARDIFVFGGLLILGFGAGMVYEPMTPIVIGAGMFWLGVKTP